jgi:hypothetical protein
MTSTAGFWAAEKRGASGCLPGTSSAGSRGRCAPGSAGRERQRAGAGSALPPRLPTAHAGPAVDTLLVNGDQLLRLVWTAGPSVPVLSCLFTT